MNSTEFRSCGFFPTAATALATIHQIKVDLAMVQMDLPDLCGIRCARELAARKPELTMILITSLRDPTFVMRAVAAGIDDYLIKPLALAQCLATLRFVACSLAGPGLLPGTPASRPSRGGELSAVLSKREEQVLTNLAKGLLYKEIGDELHISEAVVKKLQHRVYDKLHVHTRTEAIQRWSELAGRPVV